MSLEIQGAFLVETFPHGGRAERRARLVEARPEGDVRSGGTVMVGGQRYVVGHHFQQGIRQGRAVAWPKES